eukprot:10220030-Ditylum_brightwellii.AAC.1
MHEKAPKNSDADVEILTESPAEQDILEIDDSEKPQDTNFSPSYKPSAEPSSKPSLEPSLKPSLELSSKPSSEPS